MSELSPEARALILATRTGDDPRPEDERRVLRSLALRAGASVAIGGAAAAIGKHAAGASAAKAAGWLSLLGSPGAKIVTALVVGGGLSASGYLAYQAVGQRPPDHAVPAVAPAHEPSTDSPAEMRAPKPRPEEPPVIDVESLEPVPEPSSAKGSKRTADESGASSLGEEVAAVAAANRAMQDGDPERALRILEENRALLRDGALREESAVARILALCRAGNTEQASREAAQFLQAHPASPLAGRVRSSCAYGSTNERR